MEIFDEVLNKDVDSELAYAHKEVEQFNYENSKKKYIAALEECEDRGGHDFYGKQ